ncbi:uncharacterized protein TNCV_1278071 [Trichonephila clavipes]|nr:uncharacterized protein TNCV_1278071 [Trichonephila clavipes]
MQPDLRMHICEHSIRVLQHQIFSVLNKRNTVGCEWLKDVNQKQLISVKHDFAFTCRNCGGGDRGRVAIYRPFGEVSLSLNRTVTCMVLKANDRRTSCPCHDEFRGPRSDYVRQSEANLQVYVETPLHPEKLTVWCDLWPGGILLQKR